MEEMTIVTFPQLNVGKSCNKKLMSCLLKYNKKVLPSKTLNLDFTILKRLQDIFTVLAKLREIHTTTD